MFLAVCNGPNTGTLSNVHFRFPWFWTTCGFTFLTHFFLLLVAVCACAYRAGTKLGKGNSLVLRKSLRSKQTRLLLLAMGSGGWRKVAAKAGQQEVQAATADSGNLCDEGVCPKFHQPLALRRHTTSRPQQPPASSRHVSSEGQGVSSGLVMAGWWKPTLAFCWAKQK